MEPRADQLHPDQLISVFYTITMHIAIKLSVWMFELDLMEPISRFNWTICSDDSHHDRSLPFVIPEAVA